MTILYSRFYENKARKYVSGKRYRLGNPNHPFNNYYKQHGMDKTLKHMKITGEKHIKHTSSRVGDLSEFYAVTWLWDQGYEVFPNAGSQGMVDMIAWHPETEKVILIDVKTVRVAKKDKNKCRNGRTPAQVQKNVCLLLYNADTRQLKFVEHRDG